VFIYRRLESIQKRKFNPTTLSTDIWIKIIGYLSAQQLSSLTSVCRFFHFTCSSDVFWKPIYFTTYYEEVEKEVYDDVLYKHLYIEKRKGVIKIGQLWKKK